MLRGQNSGQVSEPSTKYWTSVQILGENQKSLLMIAGGTNIQQLDNYSP